MKNILITSALVFGLVGCVSTEQLQKQQEVQNNPLKSYNQVVDLQGMSKKQIYDKSKQWVAKSFKSANNVIQYTDENEGKIIGKGNTSFPCSGYIECTVYARSNINFTLTIDVKDNKARLSFDDLGIYMPPSNHGGIYSPGGDSLPIWQEKHKPLVQAKLKSVVDSYVKDILQSKTDSNW